MRKTKWINQIILLITLIAVIVGIVFAIKAFIKENTKQKEENVTTDMLLV